MDSSFWFDTIKGLKLPNEICILIILKISFVFAKSVETDEMPNDAAFHQVFTVCQSTNYKSQVYKGFYISLYVVTSLNKRAINDNPADCMNSI